MSQYTIEILLVLLPVWSQIGNIGSISKWGIKYKYDSNLLFNIISFCVPNLLLTLLLLLLLGLLLLLECWLVSLRVVSTIKRRIHNR